jgi:hypothetical protein
MPGLRIRVFRVIFVSVSVLVITGFPSMVRSVKMAPATWGPSVINGAAIHGIQIINVTRVAQPVIFKECYEIVEISILLY